MVIKEIRLILGDQLYEGHSWFEKVSPEVLYLMMEVRSEESDRFFCSDASVCG